MTPLSTKNVGSCIVGLLLENENGDVMRMRIRLRVQSSSDIAMLTVYSI